MRNPATNLISSSTEHLAQYLTRRDLVNSSPYQFDDKPGNCHAWKSSYNNISKGWVLVGDVSLGKVHKPTVNTDNGQSSIYQPSTGLFHVKVSHNMKTPERLSKWTGAMEQLGQTVFIQNKYDNKLAYSLEEEIFLKIMDNVFRN